MELSIKFERYLTMTGTTLYLLIKKIIQPEIHIVNGNLFIGVN